MKIAFFAALNCGFAFSAEVLYNGIELPEKWPPPVSVESILGGEPMPVPYLKKPPAIIPVNVGRQLFVDDFLIEHTTLKRVFHQPQYHAKSPVLHAEKDWEKDSEGEWAGAYSDGVWFDPRSRQFMLWYRTAKRGTALALSPDGLEWSRPSLDLEPGTNVVLRSVRDAATVWLDENANDPARRFNMVVARSKKGGYRLALRSSADGIHWSDEIAESGPSWDRSTVFWNPFRKVWVASVRGHDHLSPPPVHRIRCYHEGRSLEEAIGWKQNTDDVAQGKIVPGDLQPWVGADRLDPRNPNPRFKDLAPQLYNLDAFPYESLMIGLFTIWQGPDNETMKKENLQKRNEVLAGFSRDGFHWDRPSRERFLPVSDQPGAWNAANVQSCGGGCVVMGDELWFYCSGRANQWNSIVSTGLATLRRDGFASMEAGANEGTLTTRPVKFSGKHLFVNAAAPQGELRVEALDADGKVIAPFTKENCLGITADKTLLQVKWNGADDLSKLTDQAVKLRFHLKSGALYSFWITPDANGASHGYVAAGGPGFTEATDTTGK